MLNREAVAFLLRVWKLQCKPGDHVCLSSKGSGWSDYSFPYDDHLGLALDEWLTRYKDRDLYFCPLPFSEARRVKANVIGSRLLWSDIDHADPYRCEPSILWESSPGRHQGLWILPKFIAPEKAAEGSKNLAYFLGADKGGWDLTQVLRIPGTHNYKYPEKPMVKLIWNRDTVLARVPQRPIDKWRSTIPRKTLRIIEGPAEQGKRSDMLWFLEHELCDLGIPIADVISILKESDWNKYRGRADEDERFDSEMVKIREDRDDGRVTRIESLALHVVDYAQLMGSSQSNPGWLVRDFWTRNSHGIVAGEPKAFKSTLVLDMLFSVASDKPFLGSYPVEYGGPVLIVQNENADWIMKDRLEKLAMSRGEVGSVKYGTRMSIEWARNLPILFINQQGFTLDDAANKAALEELIRIHRPVAINLDPLYLMFSGDVNSAKDLNPVLNWALYIKQEYDCSIILVHHYNKGNGETKRGGQRMLGSTTLHGWVESAWYLAVDAEMPGSVIVEREFRGVGGYPKIQVDLDIGKFGEARYEVSINSPNGGENLENDIVDVLKQSGGKMSATEISRKVGVSVNKMNMAIARLRKSGVITKVGARYEIVK